VLSRCRVLPALLLAVVSVAISLPAAPASAAPTQGLNDWACRPSAEHPRPVVLLHGLGTNAEQHWALLGPRIADAGYCVFSVTYGADALGRGGQATVDASAREVGGFVDRVLRETGAAKVDLVGHSLGGMVSLYVTKVTGYAPKVGRVVALAPPTRGTTLFGLVRMLTALGLREPIDTLLAGGCIACVDLLAGGPAVRRLNDGPVARRGVTYTVIASRYDAIVTPPSRSFIREPGVRNYYVQDVCPLDPVGHFGMGFDPGIASLILNGLDPTARIRCGFGPPV
jgi:triacylglycerol esterase/lipase EstA (alpha/beta hydrolase family)